MKTQKANWLLTGPFLGVYRRYFCAMVAVSAAATWHVSALCALGILTIPVHRGGG